jgi:NAD(P)-dependent dehydrogenase (short-subunit alcohol dehydrogenase family)
MDEKNVLVIGGSSGIGLEIVKKLTARNCSVYVGSRTSEALATVAGVHHIPLDVMNESIALDDLPAELHGLAYCPGTIRLRPFQRVGREEFLEDLQINFLGAVNVIQQSLSRLRKSKSGASVVLFSTVAVQTGMPFHASIASAKGAVEGLTRSLAAEFAPRIRVNAIAPSLTETPLADSLLSSEDKRRASAERHPLKRIGSPGEIAGVAVHLLSDGGSWITGQIIHVDGGMGSLRTFK